MTYFDPRREQLERRSFTGRWEIKSVYFPTADTDIIVTHSVPTAAPEQLNYQVARANGPAVIYHDGSPDRRPWGDGYIILRCNVAPVTVDVLITAAADNVNTRTLPSGVFTTPATNADTLDGLDSTAFAQNSFVNIAVSGQTTVVADSPTDTLTLEAGSGVVITTTAGSDKVTVAATATGTVTTTGSPASGNLAKFSGASALTNGDLSGDISTSSTLVTTAKTALKTRAIDFVVDGGGVAITTGLKEFRAIPFDCTILSWTILSADVTGPAISGSIVFDVWKDTFANYPPTVADTITAAAKPTLTTAISATSSTLTGWTTAIVAGDVLAIKVDSITSVTRVILQLVVST